MSNIFAQLHGKTPDHTITTILGTVVSFYLSETPPIAVKEIAVLAIKNGNDMELTANQYVTSHQHEDPNVSSVIAWEKSPLKNEQYTLRLAFHFMNRFSLAQIIDSTTLSKMQFPEPALQSMAKQMLSGLWYLNKQKHTIHRNIKPSNVLLNSDGLVQIADFGHCASSVTTYGVNRDSIGQTMYFSPERVNGSHFRANADIWALGMVLFECWMGRYPFLQPGQELRDLDEEDVLECIDEDNERSVQSLVSSDTRMGEAMKRFLLRCLDRSPNTRPAAIDLMSDPWLTGVDQQGLRDFLQSPNVCADVPKLVACISASNPARDG